MKALRSGVLGTGKGDEGLAGIVLVFVGLSTDRACFSFENCSWRLRAPK
jgi:hypothetical protein